MSLYHIIRETCVGVHAGCRLEGSVVIARNIKKHGIALRTPYLLVGWPSSTASCLPVSVDSAEDLLSIKVVKLCSVIC